MQVAPLLAQGIGYIAVGIIVWGVLRGAGALLALEIARLRHSRNHQDREFIRRDVAYYILLSMEFLIAADMIRTITHPTLDELATLGLIIAIRTVTSHFLMLETQKSTATRE